jgi:hypothetical protein
LTDVGQAASGSLQDEQLVARAVSASVHVGEREYTALPQHRPPGLERAVDADAVPAALSPNNVVWLARARQTRTVQPVRVDAIGETCGRRASAPFSVSIAVVRASVRAASTMVVPPFPQPSSGIFSG